MAAAESTSHATGCAIHVRIEARGLDLYDDAQRASLAVAEWLTGQPMDWLAVGRAEFASIANGEIEGDENATRYGRLVIDATAIATEAATKGWSNPDAFVTVDIVDAPGRG